MRLLKHAGIEDTMSSTEIFNISHLFMSWLKLEIAYQHGLTDFLGMEGAFDSHDIPTEYLKHSPIYSVKENDYLRVHLMETALYKDKAHREYTKLFELTQAFLSSGVDIPQFETNVEKQISIEQFHNIGVGFLNYIKLKNEYEALNKEFIALTESKNTNDMMAKNAERNTKFTESVNLYHMLLDIAYECLKVRNVEYEVVAKRIKEWFPTA